MSYPNEWEVVAHSFDYNGVLRLKVPHGWIVRPFGFKKEMIFIADEGHTWEISK